MKRRATAIRLLGFSLIEVMIALIITCVGMLGIAKLEAVVLSNTGSSRLRALVALEAASLADAMHADRDFWDGTSGGGTPDWTSTVGVSVTVTAGTPAFSATNSGHLSTALSAMPACTASCSPVNLAAHDLNQWANGPTGLGGGLAQVLKTSTSSISCIAQTVLNPATCTITINWSENTVAANQQEAQTGAPASFASETYTLVVQP